MADIRNKILSIHISEQIGFSEAELFTDLSQIKDSI